MTQSKYERLGCNKTLFMKTGGGLDLTLGPGLPGGSAGEESAHNVGDLNSIPGLGGSPGEGKSYPL